LPGGIRPAGTRGATPTRPRQGLEITLLSRNKPLKEPALRVLCTLAALFLLVLMKVRFFVAGTAALLGVWLGATFVSEVPVDRYPQFGRGSVPLSAKAAKPLPRDKPATALVAEDEAPVAAFE
jgi:hypothetical protein